MRLATIALLACALAARADDKDELKRLEGTWEVTALEMGGQDKTKDPKAPQKLVIADGRLTGLGPELKATTDATQKPKWLNLTFTRDGQERTVNAIYELAGDELKIAMPLAPAGKTFENKRPDSFDTKDKLVMLVRAKRAK